MSKPFEEIANLDKLIHEPARLAIMTALSACSSADFTFLLQLIGLSKGNLSSHLSKLEEGGLVQIEKRFRRPFKMGADPLNMRVACRAIERISTHFE